VICILETAFVSAVLHQIKTLERDKEQNAKQAFGTYWWIVGALFINATHLY